MIKTWFKISGIIAVAITSTKVSAQNITYNLTGKVGLYSAPAKAYLMYLNGTDRHIDSVIVTKGMFAFKGTSDCPKQATLFINSKGTGFMSYDVGFLNLYLEPGNISITSADVLQNAKISGGPLNKDYAELSLALNVIDTKLDKLNDIYSAASPEKQRSTKFRDSIIKESFLVEDEKKIVGLAFMKSHPSSEVSLAALGEYAGLYPDSKLVEPAFNLLSAKVRYSKAGLSYASNIARMKKTAIGVIAPDFTLTDTLGKAVSLHDLKGKYVLIDFWASWCGPCRAENPNLVKAYNLYKQKNFTILGVTSDGANAKEQWLKAIHDDHLPWMQVADLNKGAKNEADVAYNITNIPQNVLISPEGKIIDKNLRGDELMENLRKLFGE